MPTPESRLCTCRCCGTWARCLMRSWRGCGTLPLPPHVNRVEHKGNCGRSAELASDAAGLRNACACPMQYDSRRGSWRQPGFGRTGVAACCDAALNTEDVEADRGVDRTSAAAPRTQGLGSSRRERQLRLWERVAGSNHAASGFRGKAQSWPRVGDTSLMYLLHQPVQCSVCID